MNRLTDPTPDAGWLRALLMSRAPDDRPDAELLDRFARYGEQPAFEAILRRHGPLVWGVCRRTLADPADADDAFQATFLVLVQKAGRVTDGGRLGPWLYGVAVRVARRAKERAAKAPTADPEVTAMLPARAEPDDGWRPILDRELHALPAKFREPVVLCDLQGLSRAVAAERLRLREGTLSSRLARGRMLLRKRLLKHGTLLPAGGVAALLATTTAGGAVPARLLGRAAETAARVTVAGGVLAGVAPATVLKLTTEATTGMALLHLKVGGALLLTLTAVTLGLASGDGPPAKPDTPAEPPKAVAVTPAPEKPAVIEGDLAALQGLWDVELVPDGSQKATDPPKANRCLVRGDVLWMISPDWGFTTRLTIRLTPDRLPKWIDLTATPGTHSRFSGGGGSLDSPGIYRVTADGWEMTAKTHMPKLRPVEFETVMRQGVETFRFRRPTGPLAPQDTKTVASRRNFIGRWRVARYDWPAPDRSKLVDFAGGLAEVTPEYLFVQHPMQLGKLFTWHAAEYSLDDTKRPKWADFKNLDMKLTLSLDQSGYGVYDLEGDTLRICYRMCVPRVLRTLEFKPGIGPPNPGSEKEKPGPDTPACALLELKRIVDRP